MRMIRTALIVGAATLGLAGAAIAAERHVMNVDLPSGAVAEITYEGDVAPVVKIVPARETDAALSRIRYVDPFADFDRMFAAMQARHVALMRLAAALAAQAEAQSHLADGAAAIRQVSAGGAPAGGGYSYTFVSTSSGNGTCGQVVEVTSRPNTAPQRISRTFGDCGGATPAPSSSAPTRAAPAPAQPTI